MKQLLYLLFLAICVSSCQIHSHSSNQGSQEADLYYILSTEVLHAYDSEGTEIYNSQLCPADTLAMYAEKEYVRKHYAGDLRYFAPYYEQFTMASTMTPAETFAGAYHHAKQDMKNRFLSYMENENQGRPFFLMGFSQGAMIALDLLKEMPEEQYARCKGVYLLGYRVTQEDMQHPHIHPATDATSGNVISFNSISRPDASLPLVSQGAATCINPLNWKIDPSPAQLVYKGDTATVSVDTTLFQLMVSGLDEQKYVFMDFAPGCLHHWDLLFYASSIKENLTRRLME